MGERVGEARHPVDLEQQLGQVEVREADVDLCAQAA